ncbi:hypothetical protein EDEG_01700 [Edhazardia aedis USNM 41457]|uniref:Uncharacterized protein n=1 Tax=Edhazardia aedis (strain USNM 41457) TaxID=1003232 RepID=J9D8A1_EDHAE|nr:hypothetical protein EDEG_01700 [Edhazardia aedis USNM 41457]|eukprot:EJW04006.1 hypothetical protein EDEG_01700 [Edhazardia aedis USNM 41457]
MVRMKYRYIGLEVRTNRGVRISQDSYKDIIYDLVEEKYGITVTCHMRHFQLFECLMEHNVVIFRVPRLIYRQVCDSLNFPKDNSLNFIYKILTVNGTARNAKKRVLTYLIKQSKASDDVKKRLLQ